jgi:hypothetical protein
LETSLDPALILDDPLGIFLDDRNYVQSHAFYRIDIDASCSTCFKECHSHGTLYVYFRFTLTDGKDITVNQLSGGAPISFLFRTTKAFCLLVGCLVFAFRSAPG